jgi:hypothetical protein
MAKKRLSVVVVATPALAVAVIAVAAQRVIRQKQRKTTLATKTLNKMLLRSRIRVRSKNNSVNLVASVAVAAVAHAIVHAAIATSRTIMPRLPMHQATRPMSVSTMARLKVVIARRQRTTSLTWF